MLSRFPLVRASASRAAVRSLATESVPSSASAPPPPLTPNPNSNATPSSRPRARFHPAPRAPSSTPPAFLPYLSPSFGRNQLLHVPDETRALLEEIVAQFQAPIRYAFAYGSGVFAQDGYARRENVKDGPMLDFVFAVTHADHWHSINLAQYPGHYPFHARLLGSEFVAGIEKISPGLWFNTYVPMKGATIKYGVTTVDNLCSDLLNWNTLYLAGRMHKPIRIIKDDPRVRLTQQVNLVSAVRVALLTLPSSFSETALFERIAGLSYGGDPRMLLPTENRAKVGNIVRAQAPQFRELYYRLVSGLPGVHWRPHATEITQDDTAHARAALLRKLPAHVLARVTRHYSHQAGFPSREADDGAFWSKMAADSNLSRVVRKETAGVVRYPALVQSVKGLMSAGLVKSVRYTSEKAGKWWGNLRS